MEVDFLGMDLLDDIFSDTDSKSINTTNSSCIVDSTQYNDVELKTDASQVDFDDIDFSEDFWKNFLLDSGQQGTGSVSSDISDHTYERDTSLSPMSEFLSTSSPDSVDSLQEPPVNENQLQLHEPQINENQLPLATVQYSVVLDNAPPGEIGAQEVVFTSETEISEHFMVENLDDEDYSSFDNSSPEPFTNIFAEMNYCKVETLKSNTREVHLTDEEKLLMKKEGFSLPTHLPLTKQEERDLKKIRRKIRNKQAAQDSRKRKKEYVDGLENRVRMCSAQNAFLQKKVKVLEKQNSDLMSQLKQLKSIITSTSIKPTQTSTSVMVLLFSFALLLMPSFKPASWSEGSSPAIVLKNPPISGHSRNLLFAVEPDSYDQQASVSSVDDKLNQSLKWDVEYMQKEIARLIENRSEAASDSNTSQTLVVQVAENH